MEEENINMEMAIFMMEIFKKEWKKEEGDFNGSQERLMKGIGVKIWWMDLDW